MANVPEKKLQIVAFSTSDSSQTPNEIINLFLEQHTHKIIKKSRHSIAFSINIKDSPKEKTIMVYSILDLSREYTGVTDVNCYLLFIDLEKEDSIKKLNDIIDYARDFCDLMKKIFVIGMVSGNEKSVKAIDKTDITKILDQLQANYEYKEINKKNAKEVSDTFMEILEYSSKHSINGLLRDEKEANQANSCEVF